MDCIFCKIVTGEIPCYRIYEDESVLAFLDINPVSSGHTLVIPKKHYENIYDISEGDLANVTMVTKNLAKKYKQLFEADGITIHQANEKAGGQIIFHYHMHIVPRYFDDGLKLWFHRDANKKIDLETVWDKIKRGFK
ncbi:MAG: HIT family protein [Candidatus Micrarchaeia archaeon]